MYRLLIVDDEKIERNGIKFLLKRLNMEFDITEATNGKAALEYLNDHEVDILLTDVRMPFMDGLELIENVRSSGNTMKCIIFSGCNEFDYARQAVKLGVSDYILKPINPKEFENTLTKVITEMEEERAENSLMNKSIEYMSEHMLYMAANGSLPTEIEEYNKGIISSDFLNNFARILLIEFNGDFYGKKGMEFKEGIREFDKDISMYLNLNQCQSLLFYNDESADIIKKANDIHTYIHTAFDEESFIAISSPVGDMTDIASKVEELDLLMENRFYHTECNVYYDGMKNDEQEIIQIDDDTLMKQMKQDVKMKDANSLRQHFDRFCSKYRKKTDFSQIYIKFLFANLLKAFEIGNEKKLNADIETLYKSNDFEEVSFVVSKRIDELEEAFGNNPQMIHKEIEVIKDYIYEHYGEELSVDALAEMVYMAPSYLSAVFKKETGQNLSKFIKEYRMERAKEQLSVTMKKIVDIAIDCGYPNVSYFCSSFREYYGVSPQKFRENGDSAEE